MPDARALEVRAVITEVPLSHPGGFHASLFRSADDADVLVLAVGHLAVRDDAPAVRIHSACTLGESLGSRRCDCRWQLEHALDIISTRGVGAVVYLPGHDGRGAGLATVLRSYALMDRGLTTRTAFEALGGPADLRDYSAATAVMRELGLREVDLITNNPAKLHAVEASGIMVRHRIPSVMASDDPFIRRYLRSKGDEFGHLIDGELR